MFDVEFLFGVHDLSLELEFAFMVCMVKVSGLEFGHLLFGGWSGFD